MDAQSAPSISSSISASSVAAHAALLGTVDPSPTVGAKERSRHDTRTEPTALASAPDQPTADDDDEDDEDGGGGDDRRGLLAMSRQKLERPGSSSPRAATQNGRATGFGSPRLGPRRKNASLDSSAAASHTDELVARHDFIIEDEFSSESSHSFWDLPVRDRRNFTLLVLLYFLQGIPMGLAGGSVPFLLKSHFSYGQIGVFTLAAYPYSLKLLWSPIVDAVWSRRLGRRKSWILPIQVLSGMGMIWLGARAEQMMKAAEAGGGAGIWGFTWWWFFLVFLCATQDIAVDGEHSAFGSISHPASIAGLQHCMRLTVNLQAGP